MVVLDTHAAVWWSTQPKLLSARAAAAIAAADRLSIPSIVFWEVALLVRKRRLVLSVPVRKWADELRSIPRVTETALTTDTALAADGLSMHADPADRFIVASALELGAPLVTKDGLLRRLKFVRTVW